MVHKYSLSKEGKMELSKHFQVYEFASTSPNPYHPTKTYNDVVLVDIRLIEILEELFNKLRASKCVITSGYRTTEHDIAVGGNGKGQHCLGKAVDCIFYSKKGNIIDSKYVACVCQCMDVPGIAPINSRAIHIDVRSNGYYKGDERVSYNTVTSDFFRYYNITMESVLKYLDKI